MDDLVTWLRAQLDDDERVALGIDGLSDDTIGDVAHMAGSGAVEYLRRFHLDRTLAEVDAKRRIVNFFEYDRIDVSKAGGPPETIPGRRPAIAHPVLRLLALPYADRPGYREDWRPE